MKWSPIYVGTPHPPGRVTTSLLEVDDGRHRHRLNSRYLRELTCGKFIIKFEEITLLESIGQGILGELHRLEIYMYIHKVTCCRADCIFLRVP